MKFRSIIMLAFCVLLVVACKEKQGGKTEPAKAEPKQGNGNNVSLTDAQMKGADIGLGAVEMKNLTSVIKVNGTLEVSNQNKALVTSLAGGVLQRLDVHPGEYVRKGQEIGAIANSEVSGMQQQLISINAQLKFAEQERARQEELVAGNAAPYKNLQKVESEMKTLRAERSALQRQLNILGVSPSGPLATSISIKAPISGNIAEVIAQIGSNVTANAAIAEIINISDLHVNLSVYEKDLPKVTVGQVVRFAVTTNPGKEYDAKIFAIGTALSNETKAVPVHAHVINDKAGLIDGMSVTARINLGHDVYPAVPDEAVINNGGNDYIFVLSETRSAEGAGERHMTTFQRVQVVRGTSDAGYTQIEPVVSLPAGTKIVVKGAFFLIAKMTNTAEEE